MATTKIPNELVMKAWAKDTWEAAIEETFFNKFTGRNNGSVIQVKEELAKGKGTSINIPLIMPLKGPGVLGDNKLEGNEEQLAYRSFDVYLQRIRNGVVLEGKFEEHKTQIDMRRDAKVQLARWLADYIDKSIFAVLTGILPEDFTADKFPFPLTAPTADRVLFGGGKTSEGALTPADKFTADMIGVAKRMATMQKDKRMHTVKDQGRDLFIMVIDPCQARDLRNDPKWLRAQELANVRGEKNPIFSGALGLYDGVIVHECGRVPRTATGASDGMVGHGLFLGAQAVVFAEGERPEWAEKRFDYENQWGAAFGRMFGLQKAQFKFDGVTDTDFGVINVITSSSSDA